MTSLRKDLEKRVAEIAARRPMSISVYIVDLRPAIEPDPAPKPPRGYSCLHHEIVAVMPQSMKIVGREAHVQATYLYSDGCEERIERVYMIRYTSGPVR